MSKLDHIAEGRAQGLAFALKICKEAQKDGANQHSGGTEGSRLLQGQEPEEGSEE